MPNFTSLAFYRDKQTIDNYDKERPKSLPAFRSAARECITRVQDELRAIELAYLQPFTTQEEYIQETMPSIKMLLSVTNTASMTRKSDFELVKEKVGYLGEKAALYKISAETLQKLGEHIHNFIPNAFDELVERLNKLLTLMDKYCLSFYTGPQQICPDTFLETPFKYELKRKERIDAVKISLKYIFEISQKFNSVGIKLENFTMKVEQLARRGNCRNVLFFLLFPSCGEKILDTCEILLGWLEEDHEYVEGLSNDLKSMTHDEVSQTSERQKIYDEMIRTRHYVELCEKEHSNLEKLLNDLYGRKKMIEEEHHSALVDYMKVEGSIYKNKFRLDEIREHADKYSKGEFHKLLHEQRKAMTHSKTELPLKLKSVNRVENKLTWFKTKEERLEYLKKEKSKKQGELAKIMINLTNSDRNLDHLKKMKIVIRNIYNLKTDTGTMKKVFHGLQLESRLKFLNSSQINVTPPEIRKFMPQDDTLTTAIRFTAHFIEQDWFRLYFALPFHPIRGRADVEQDVEKINKTYVRGSLFELAMEALRLWRRLHIRANLPGLVSALEKIERMDIIEKIDKRLYKLQREAEGFVEPKAPSLSPVSRMLLQRQRTLPSIVPGSRAAADVYKNKMNIRSHTMVL